MNTMTEQTMDGNLSVNSDVSLWLSEFIRVYQNLSTDNLSTLNDIYHCDISFQDPLHQVQGLNALQDYFAGLYENLSSCEFVIDHYFQQGNEAAIYWQMTYCHPKLNGGNDITVSGHSHIKSLHNKVIYHRDYLDAGAMLYEHVPVFGSLIKWLKKRVS